MTHKRETIRNRATTLVTGLSTTGSNVFASRVYPVESASLPALLVYLGSEDVDPEMDAMGTTKVVMAELNLEVRAAQSANLDDQLDDILEEVQAAIATDRKLNGALIKRLDYQGVDGPEWIDEGKKATATMTIKYLATYEVTL